MELSCGGWLALASQRGQSVGLLDLSAGELATNGSVSQRRDEAQQAATLLGLRFRSCLDLPDGGIDASDAHQVDALVAALRQHKPRLVLAPVPHDRHPDHTAAGALVQRAVFFANLAKHRPDLGPRHSPTRLIQYPQREEVRPDFVVDISSTADLKQRAIACHRSQVGPGTATLLNAPLGTQAWAVRDRYWGASIGVSHGEPYVLGAPVPLADPIAHFAELDAPPVLVPPR